MNQRNLSQIPETPRRKRAFVPHPAVVVFSVLALFVVMSNSLTGCSSQPLNVTHVFGFGGPPELPAEAQVELARLQGEYDKTATAGGDKSIQLDHLADAFRRVRSDYVHKVDDHKLVNAALEGIHKLDGQPNAHKPEAVAEAALDAMLASLDPHSAYLNPVEYRESRIVTSGEFGGLGIEINMENGWVKIISPIEDTPADRAGLKSGDYITHIDGDPIKAMSLTEAVRRMRGKPGTDVRLTVVRNNGKPFDLTVTRDIIRVKPVKWRTVGDIGVLRITKFNQRTESELEAAVEHIRDKEGDRLKGYVVDLRNNPGGLLNQSVAVADSFLQRGAIVSVRDRSGIRRSFDARRGDITGGLPMVVLINAGSASASEIVAGALQDHHRATILGARSYGKGSVQTITPLEWDGALRLTTALYYLPSGRSIQGGGIEPDISVTDDHTGEAKHESDNPNAIAGVPPHRRGSLAQLQEKSCPKPANGDDDRLLGCAIAFLTAGSRESFLALVDAKKAM
jgi:carboxyl-terminal processing protease